MIILDLMLFNSFYQNKLICCQFHTSSPRRIHPLLWIFLKPALKGVAWITGRSTRKWYRQLPVEKRSIFTQHLSRHKYKYIGIFGTIGATVAIHYYTHIETAPITGRRRYMTMSADNLKEFFAMNQETHAKEYCNSVFSHDSEQTQLIARIAKRIIASNMDIPCVNTIKWNIRVIDSDIKNAFVLPSGDIYFCGGWLKTIANEDQVAIILSHEIAHAILGHSVEQLSYLQIIDTLALFGAFFIWAVFPSDWTSFCVNYIFEKYISLIARLPFSRQLESEADEVGLMLAAKACYDVREAPSFWQVTYDEDKTEIPDFFHTHPSSDKRAENLNEMIPMALDIRRQCNCYPLGTHNKPRPLNLSKNLTNKQQSSPNIRK